MNEFQLNEQLFLLQEGLLLTVMLSSNSYIEQILVAIKAIININIKSFSYHVVLLKKNKYSTLLK